MNPTRRIIGWAALMIWLGLWLGGCVAPGKPVVEATLAPSATKAIASSSVVVPTASATTDSLYPGPQDTAVFDPLQAYPGVELTETAQIQTLTALPTVTMTTTPTLTSTPTLSPAPTMVPTRGPLAKLLPAPLYFTSFSPDDKTPHQVWRLERDGYTLRQITYEEKGAGLSDVAVDGRLLYYSDNNLFVSDALGGGRDLVVKGLPPPALTEWDQWFSDKEHIMDAHWSPDGKKIAYYRDGVNLLNLASGETIKVVKGPEWKTNEAGVKSPVNTHGPYYFPKRWTPDGRQIVIEELMGEQARTLFAVPLPNAELVRVDFEWSGLQKSVVVLIEAFLHGVADQIKRQQIKLRIARAEVNEARGDLGLEGLEVHAGFIIHVAGKFNDPRDL